ncbi:hypothetical protein BC937DRAFT_94173 [Endogone sp. FLAS-F59071]|nr:hypothetical protein BC937DRAFT_94173 [Endogone sp. FLAS-F59071]|eukprot:RUS14212.1 hypothetical protein BC937DRAFT_94173 [Endogone sp. FLAS-F59071]
MHRFSTTSGPPATYQTHQCQSCTSRNVVCDRVFPHCGSCLVFARDCTYPPDSKETSLSTHTNPAVDGVALPSITSPKFFFSSLNSLKTNIPSVHALRGRQQPVAKSSIAGQERGQQNSSSRQNSSSGKQPRRSKTAAMDVDAALVEPYVNVFRHDKQELDEDAQNPDDDSNSPLSINNNNSMHIGNHSNNNSRQSINPTKGSPKNSNNASAAAAAAVPAAVSTPSSSDHHPQPWRVVTPTEYKAMQTNDASWQVTTSNDFTLWTPDGAPSDSTPMIIQRTKLRGRPPRIKRPRPSDEMVMEMNIAPPPPPPLPPPALSPAAPVAIKTESPQPSPPTPLYSRVQVVPSAPQRQYSPVTEPLGSHSDDILPTLRTHLYTDSGSIVYVDIDNVDNLSGLLSFLHDSLNSGDLPISNTTEGGDVTPNRLRIDGHLLAQYMQLATPDLCGHGNREMATLLYGSPSPMSSINTSLTLEHSLLNMAGLAMRRYLECGNIMAPVLPSGYVLACYEKLLNPLDHPLIMAITAAWIAHTLCSHQESATYNTAEKAKPLQEYFAQRAMSLFEETFDNPTFVTLCCIGALMRVVPAKHKTFHRLAGCILQSMNYQQFVFRDLPQPDSGRLSANELRRRMWWFWYLNDSCCSVIMSPNNGPLPPAKKLILPEFNAYESEDDKAGVQFFVAMCLLRDLKVKAEATATAITPLSAEEHAADLESVLSRWYDDLPSQFRRDSPFPSSGPVWSFYITLELKIHYYLTLISIHQYSIFSKYLESSPTPSTLSTPSTFQPFPSPDSSRHVPRRSTSPSPISTPPPSIPSGLRHSRDVCLRSCASLVNCFQTAITHGYCRPNIRRLEALCKVLPYMVDAPNREADHAAFAVRTLVAAAEVIKQSKEYAFDMLGVVQLAETLEKAIPSSSFTTEGGGMSP